MSQSAKRPLAAAAAFAFTLAAAAAAAAFAAATVAFDRAMDWQPCALEVCRMWEGCHKL